MTQSPNAVAPEGQPDHLDVRHINLVRYADQAPPAPLVRLLSDADTVQIAEFPNLHAAFETAPDTAILLAVPAPARHLASRIAAGLDPSEALSDWLLETGQLLENCARVRRQIFLLSAEDAATHPVAMTQVLTKQLGLTVSPAPDGQLIQDSVSQPDPILLMLARALLETDAKARNLRDILDARLVTIQDADRADVEAVRAACSTYLNLTESLTRAETDQAQRLIEMKQQLHKAEKDRDLLRDTVMHTKTEFESHLAEQIQHLSEQAKLQKQVDEATKRAQTLQTHLSDQGNALQTAHKKQKESEQQISGLEEARKQLEARVKSELDAQTKARKQADAAAKKAEEESRIALDNAEKRALALQEALHLLQQRTGKTEAALKKTEAELETAHIGAKEDLASAQRRTDKTKAELKNTKAELKNTKAELKSFQDRARLNKTALSALEKNLGIARAETKENQAQAAKQIKDLQKQLTSQKTDNARLTRDIAAERRERTRSDKAHKEELQLTRDTLRLLKTELTKQVKIVTQATADVGSLRQERADLMVKSALLVATKKQLAALQAHSAHREAILGAGLLDSGNEAAELRDQNARLRTEAAETQKQLQERAEQLENELTRIHGSRSWRLTTPLRSASSAFRSNSGS